MPSGRRGSLERYMPPRRSGGGSGTDHDSPTKSSQGGGEYGAGITDWSAALDLEDELDTLLIGDGTGETDHNEKGKYWNDNELSSWADQVDAMSPKEEKQAPRYNNYSEPPPCHIQPAQKSYQNNQNYNQQQKRVNNLPPRFQNMNKENNGGNNSYQSQQFYNSRDSSRENNTRDQDWYQKLGRGRGRGAPLRPPSGQTRPNGGNQTIAQRLLSSRHQTRHEDGGDTNGYASSNGSASTRETNGYTSPSRLAGRLNNRQNYHVDSETNGYNSSTTTRSIHEDDRLSEASFSDKKSGGGSDLRDRLNKKMKDVDRSHNYGQKFDRSSQGPSMERRINNHQNNVQHNNQHSTNGHDDRVDDFVRGIRQSEERGTRQSEDRRFENGVSSALQKTNEQNALKLNQLENTIVAKDKSISDMTAKLTEITRDKDDAINQVTAIQKDLEKKSQELEALKRQISAKDSQIETLKATLATSKAKFDM